MSRRCPLAAVAALLLLLSGACTGPTRPADPKPRAWPRMAPHEPVYASLPGTPALDTSSAMRLLADSVTAGGARWLTLQWPDYAGATLYLTILPLDGAARRDAELANRRERMALNLGGAQAARVAVDDARWAAELLVAPHGGTATPLQFVALAPDGGAIASGTVFIPAAATAPPDSLAPALDAVGTDLIHLIQSLR